MSDTVKKIIPAVFAVIMILYVANSLGWFGFGNGEAEKAAEAYVNKQVYNTLGIPAKNYSTKVIYNKNDEKMIVVKYSIENDSNWGGSCCVYYKSGVVMNATKIMPPAYDYEEHMDDLKAIFSVR